MEPVLLTGDCNDEKYLNDQVTYFFNKFTYEILKSLPQTDKERYFELFSTKNVKGLENEIYAENVFLRDWNGEWRGKEAVLQMNEDLFVNDFQIEVEKIKQFDTTTLVTFTLHIAGTQYKVADIIDWNEEGKIEQILAYNG